MASPADQYVTGLKQRFKYLATWLPNARIELGSVGVLDGRRFEYVTSLANLGIRFVERPPGKPIDMSHTSSEGVTVNFKARADPQGLAAGLGKAGASVKMSSSGAFVFQASRAVHREMSDKDAIATAMLSLGKNNVWKPEWVVVDALVEVEKATILISNSTNVELELEAKASFPGGDVALAAVEGGLSVSSQRGDVTQFLAARGLTPLFSALRLKKTFLEFLLGRDASGTARAAPPGGVEARDAFELADFSP